MCIRDRWGIETWCKVGNVDKCKHVLSLPMRNWNQKQVKSRGGCIVCFEPTYEELKHKYSLFALVKITWVLSLPMRNWNKLKIWSCTINIGLFWAYLWGIETGSSWGCSGTEIRFWAYLWGIETGAITRWKKQEGTSFEPTYEELKLHFPFYFGLWH